MQWRHLQATSTSGLGSKGRRGCEQLAFRPRVCFKEGARGSAASQRVRGAPAGGAVLQRVVRSSEQAAWLLSSPVAAVPSPTSSLTGIIDLSQVPHLPVLVPPTPGTPATAMDRLAYLPTAPQHFSSRLSSSPLSPGDASTPLLGVLGQMPWPLCSIPEHESGCGGSFLSLGLSRRPLGFQEAPLT